MDAGTFGRMRKGKLSPEGRIDLHGMTLAEAHPALISFILGSRAKGRRFVLVITGKGRVTDDFAEKRVRGKGYKEKRKAAHSSCAAFFNL